MAASEKGNPFGTLCGPCQGVTGSAEAYRWGLLKDDSRVAISRGRKECIRGLEPTLRLDTTVRGNHTVTVLSSISYPLRLPPTPIVVASLSARGG